MGTGLGVGNRRHQRKEQREKFSQGPKHPAHCENFSAAMQETRAETEPLNSVTPLGGQS